MITIDEARTMCEAAKYNYRVLLFPMPSLIFMTVMGLISADFWVKNVGIGTGAFLLGMMVSQVTRDYIRYRVLRQNIAEYEAKQGVNK